MSRREPLPKIRERVADRRSRTVEVLDRLAEAYPEARCALRYSTPWQLLVATILSAQCTDERVNLVTPTLFQRYPDPATTTAAAEHEIADIIRSTGFFRHKARNIVRAAGIVMEDHGGELPRTVGELTRLPGAARKTANVVIAECFPDQIEGIAVDTHVQRISRRLAFTREFDPVAIERELMRLIPRERWDMVTHLLIHHGRSTCTARAPRCSSCPIADRCPSRDRFE